MVIVDILQNTILIRGFGGVIPFDVFFNGSLPLDTKSFGSITFWGRR